MIRPRSLYIKLLDRFGLAEALLLVLVAVIIFAWIILIPQSAVSSAAHISEQNTIIEPSNSSLSQVRDLVLSSEIGLNPELLITRRWDQAFQSNKFQLADTRLLGVVSEVGTNQAIAAATIIITDSLGQVYDTLTNASGWYTFTDTITNPLEAGDVRITASKNGYQPETVDTTIIEGEDNQQDIQLATSDLIIRKNDGRTTVIPGQTITYTITITNVGSITASNVLITDVLPSSLSYVSDTSGITPTIPVAGTYVWSLPSSLGTGDQNSFNLRTRVANALSSPTAEIRNTARVGTSSPEANLSNNAAEDVDTGTGTPNVGITLSVTPSQVRTAQNATYTIRVTNSGTSLVTDVVIEDTFSTYLDLISTTPSKGTATTNNTTRKITVEFSVLDINETVTVTVVGRVNNTATFNTTVTNLATVRYRYGGTTTTRTSNSASFQLIVSSTLPGTGGVELDRSEQSGQPGFILPILISGIFLGVLGLFAIVFGIYTQRKPSEWSSWYIKMGTIFIATAVVLGLFLGFVFRVNQQQNEIALQLGRNSNLSKLVYLPVPEEGPVWPSNSPSEEFQTLPDYPIPSPTAEASQDAQESQDLTPVSRIIIPALNVDTVVKYVPYDGLTWKVGGLRDEVAWMGDTSWPGLAGNTALAGHVSLWDGGEGPFRYLDRLGDTDEVVLHTDENIYTYVVRNKQIVSEVDLTILQPVLDKQLTLITCTGWNPDVELYLERLVVIAELVDVSPLYQVISSR